MEKQPELNPQKTQEIKERLVYQRAIYRIHECDDPALKEHFSAIIKEYEAKYKQEEKKPYDDPRQMKLNLDFSKTR